MIFEEVVILEATSDKIVYSCIAMAFIGGGLFSSSV